MSTQNIFGIPIYHGSLENHKEIKQKLMPYFDNEKYFETPTTWLSTVKTSINTEANAEVDYKLWLQSVIEKHLDPYLKSLKPVDPRILVNTRHIWMNKYDKNDGQEIHNHVDGTTHFSCAYVVDQPEESCEFIFIDDEDYVSAHGLGQIFYFDSQKKNYFVDLKEGDIVIFPAWLNHAVSPNKSDKQRRTISANWSVRLADQVTKQFSVDLPKNVG
jgi:uncharacterized protein (TIGR02466 family)